VATSASEQRGHPIIKRAIRCTGGNGYELALANSKAGQPSKRFQIFEKSFLVSIRQARPKFVTATAVA
jgi:hypothetical protein